MWCDVVWLLSLLFSSRLQRHTSYDLHLTPDLEAFTFVGTVDIVLRVDATQLNDENAKEITLHAKELCISHAEYSVVVDNADDDSADDTTGAPVAADEIGINVKATTVRFVFGQAIPLTATKIKLTIQFTGFLNNQMCVDTMDTVAFSPTCWHVINVVFVPRRSIFSSMTGPVSIVRVTPTWMGMPKSWHRRSLNLSMLDVAFPVSMNPRPRPCLGSP